MFTDLDRVDLAHRSEGEPYLEFLRTTSMSVGLYVLAAGATDAQSPHDEDELYVVVGGHGRMTAGDETNDVGPGSVIVVARQVAHSFHDIDDELRLLVVFAPSQGSTSGSRTEPPSAARRSTDS